MGCLFGLGGEEMKFDINVIKGSLCDMRGYVVNAKTQLEAEKKALELHGKGSSVISVVEIVDKAVKK